MRIADRLITPGAQDVYIIAELGVNHDGEERRAIQLAEAAAHAGADAIKLQLFEADRLMSRAAKLAAYQKAAGETDPIAMLRRLELSIEQMAAVVYRAHALGVRAIVTVFSVELVSVAESLPWDAYKTASPDLIHLPLLRALARTNRPLILSTGAATLEEVRQSIQWMSTLKTLDRTAIMQCVSSYPTPIEHAELPGIAALAEVFAGPVGYSDHTFELDTGAHAVSTGAVLLEKHLTYSRSAVGPDHAASLEPEQFAEYVRRARAAAQKTRTRPPAPLKRVLDIERDVRTVSRQSLVLTRALPAGHVLTHADLTCKRPGTGLPPSHLDRALGARLRTAKSTDDLLTADDLI
ncbi:MAG: N-acetylneuraminate synthase family protein [Phycisphaerales bacterium]|nr:N-acetylneuraminate synthase family protein [Phycisphaerales bacterium]